MPRDARARALARRHAGERVSRTIEPCPPGVAGLHAASCGIPCGTTVFTMEASSAS